MNDPWFDLKHRLKQAQDYVEFLKAKLAESEKAKDDYRDFRDERTY